MKSPEKVFYFLSFLVLIYSCKTRQLMDPVTPQQVEVTIDLVNVKDDKVMVTIDPGKFTGTQTTTFFIPNTVPGTYSMDNYSRFIEDVRAYNYLGKELLVAQKSDNSWIIDNSQDLDKITYWVNDSFDVEGEEGIFSPAGTNILEGENFLLNLHGFVGYFENLEEQPYKLIINRPANLVAGTSMPLSGSAVHPKNQSTITDSYLGSRYFDVIDNPIMYSYPDTTHIKLGDMNVLLHVYSPNKVYTSQTIKPEVEKMMRAQKNFLGDIDNTSNYAILLYLANPENIDAQGYGALEHHTSTVVVLPETMPLSNLNKTMTDVVSHEFFHILTPLNVHSKEIHYFDYNDPQMSQHLWMYEGVTEYFAHLFQVNQGLISEQEFYSRIAGKIASSANYDDTVPFTVLSQNILNEPYKSDFYNVYLKGALIGMALDIRLRELSKGEKGILSLMKDLSSIYGKDRPFVDDELIPQIVKMTYPEISYFFDTYVTGETPIPYEEFLSKVGVEMEESIINTSYFIKGQIPYIDAKPQTGELFFRENIALNSFLKDMGVENGDIIKSVGDINYDVNNVYELIMISQSWEEGDDLNMVVIRDGEEVKLSAVISQPTDTEKIIKEMDLPESDSRIALRKEWLKG